MSGSIKEVFNTFMVKKRIAVRTDKLHKTTVVLPVPLCNAATKYCIDNKVTLSEFCRMIDAARPKEMTRTDAIRIVFSQIYFNPEGLNFND